jgi:cytochrome P450
MMTIVDSNEHRKRKKLWEPAFVPSAIKSYVPFLYNRWDQLTIQLDKRLGEVIDLPEWFGFLTVDFTGDFAYGSIFDMVARGEDYIDFYKIGQQATSALEVFGTVHWIRPIVLALPSPMDKFLAMSTEVLEKRRKEGGRIKDLAYHLVCSSISSAL